MREWLTLGGLGGEEDLSRGLVCRGLGKLDDVEVSAAAAAASEGAVEAHFSVSFFFSLSFSLCLFFVSKTRRYGRDTKPGYRIETAVWQNRESGPGLDVILPGR